MDVPKPRDLTKAAVIVNTQSRKGRTLFRYAKKLLMNHGVVADACFPVRDPKKMDNVVRTCIAKGYTMLLIGGGDGTISSIVDHLVYTDIVVGILPLGTANSFARTLGIGLTIDDALHVILYGKIQTIDMGKIGDDYFANTANIGFSATVSHNISPSLKKYFGKLAYILQGIVKFLTFTPIKLTITTTTKVYNYNVLELVIANGTYQGGILIAPQADVQSEQLLIKIVQGETKWNLIKMWCNLLLGKYGKTKYVTLKEVGEIYIDAPQKQYVNIDGEISTTTPIRVQVARKALQVLVPQ